jgi:hypothetical protein
MNEQHGNVLGGAIGETTQTAAQLATIAGTAAQTVARMRARHLAADQARDQAAAQAERAMLRSEHAAARLGWAPALERPFNSASAGEAAAVWAAAQPWVDHDRSAREAARRAEERLTVLDPQLIARYQERLAEGLAPVEAMVDAIMLPAPADLGGAAAARALAGDERGEAQRHAATPDVAATVSVDEHTQGFHAGATRTATSDGAVARAALLAAEAYPQPLRTVLGRGAQTGLPRPRLGSGLHHRRGR